MEIPMTLTFFEVFFSVQSPAEAMNKELRNSAVSLGGTQQSLAEFYNI
jgi:hypothetical protein